MLIKFLAKVNLLSEEEMENVDRNESMGLPVKGRWLVRDVAYPVESVEKIVAYTSKKCLVYIYTSSGTETLLVEETFDTLFTRWQESLQFEPELEIGSSEQDLVV